MKRTVEQLEEELVGQCLNGFTEEEQADEELMRQADEVLFNCDTCGWWFSTEDLVDDNTCQDCVDEQDPY